MWIRNLAAICMFLVVADSCRFGKDPDCTYQCHCHGDAVCDPLTGECPNGRCDDENRSDGSYKYKGDWANPACQVGNVAFGQKLVQQGMTTFNSYDADLAVDGDINPNLAAGHCSHPTDISADYIPAWWEVTFDRRYVIQRVTIFNRDSYKDRLKNTLLSLYDERGSRYDCGNINTTLGPDKMEITVPCKEIIPSTKLLLQRVGGPEEKEMNICEIFAIGFAYEDCEEGFFGAGCVTPCNCQDPCEFVNGRCATQCIAGKQGFSCQEDCNRGYFGLGCTTTCNCEGDLCNVVTGECASQCIPGKQGLTCQEDCDAGYFGSGCLIPCNCQDDCDVVSGLCPSECIAGKKGTACQDDCEDGVWGLECVGQCRCQDNMVCHKNNGTCDNGCMENVVGVSCDMALPSMSATQFNPTSISYDSITINFDPWTPADVVEDGLEPTPPSGYRLQYYSLGGNNTWQNGTEMMTSFVSNATTILSAMTSSNCCSLTQEGLQAGYTYQIQVVPLLVYENVTHLGLPTTSQMVTTLGTDDAGTDDDLVELLVIIIVVLLVALSAAIFIMMAFRWKMKKEKAKAEEQAALDANQARCMSLPDILDPEDTFIVQDNMIYENNAYSRSSEVSTPDITSFGPDFTLKFSAPPGESSADQDGIKLSRSPSESSDNYIPNIKTSKVDDSTPTGQSPADSAPRGPYCLTPPTERVLDAPLNTLHCPATPPLSYKNRPMPTTPPPQKVKSHYEIIPWAKSKLASQNPASPKLMPKPSPSASPKLLPKPSPTPSAASSRHHHYERVADVRRAATGTMSHPIMVKKLAQEIRKIKASDGGFANEYKLLAVVPKGEYTQARKEDNVKKHRFKDIMACDHSRVVLRLAASAPSNDADDEYYNTSQLYFDSSSDYINANYIPGYKRDSPGYVATQGPLPFTVIDLWRMIWQEQINHIVMITNLVELGKIKCHQYWPKEGAMSLGDFSIVINKTEVLAYYTLRSIAVVYQGEKRTVRHFHFTGWPDHGVPTIAAALLDFRRKVRSFDSSRTGPLLVHCSAGIGRTGTFIAIDHQLEKAHEEGEIDIPQYMETMRRYRAHMIQNLEQYVFVYDALMEAVCCGETVIPSHLMHDTYHALQKINPKTNMSKLQAQFQMLRIFDPVYFKEYTVDAEKNVVNNRKNRKTSVSPSDHVRPKLSIAVANTSDYINAALVSGYRKNLAYITTQWPLPVTVCDIWRLLHDHRSRTLVTLTELDPSDATSPVFWPGLGEEPLSFPPLAIQCVDAEDEYDDDVIIQRQFKITNKTLDKEESSLVTQFCLQGWPITKEAPTSPNDLLALIALVERWQQKTGDKVITVQCKDGIRQSGLFVAACYLLDKLKVDREVDVCHVVKQIRLSRLQFIPSLEQYKFLHELAIAYLDQYATYANFK